MASRTIEHPPSYVGRATLPWKCLLAANALLLINDGEESAIRTLEWWLVFGRTACPARSDVMSCQLTLRCLRDERARAFENERIGLHHTRTKPHPLALCAAGQLRRPSDAISRSKSAFAPGRHAQTSSFEPTACVLWGGFRNLTRASYHGTSPIPTERQT